eukprot:g12470.t1
MIIGAMSVLVIVVMGVGRRWKRRQLNAIDEDRHARRAGRATGRVDAWAASSERYVDHDKLSNDDAFKHENDPAHSDNAEEDEVVPDNLAGEPGDGPRPEEEDNDPYGLFSDTPYQDPDDDEDDLNDEDDDDWEEDDDRR